MTTQRIVVLTPEQERGEMMDKFTGVVIVIAILFVGFLVILFWKTFLTILVIIAIIGGIIIIALVYKKIKKKKAKTLVTKNGYKYRPATKKQIPNWVRNKWRRNKKKRHFRGKKYRYIIKPSRNRIEYFKRKRGIGYKGRR